MFFNSKTHTAGHTDVSFGFELQGICPTELVMTVGEAVQNSVRLVRSLYAPSIDMAFELSAVSRHAGDLGPSLSFRARVSHRDSAAASAKAHEVAEGLRTGLDLWERHRWAPLDEGRYKQLYEGAPSGHVWEISRRSQLLELAPGRDAVASSRFSLAVYPFIPQPDPMSRVMNILNHCRERMRVSVVIAPVRLSERELKFLTTQRELLNSDANEAEALPPNHYGAMALLGTAGMAEFLKDSSFLLRVYAASSGPIPEVTANSLGCALAAPAVPSHAAGGFKMHLIADAAEKRVAEANLEEIRCDLPSFPAGTPWGRLPMIVTALEAAAVFRFPAAPCPGLERVRRAIPYTGMSPDKGTLIGYAASAAGDRSEVRIDSDSRLRHVYITGATGVGKSSLMLSMALQDLAEGHGLCLLDPHGDLFSRVLTNVPASRLKDVMVFDCSLPVPGFTFNLLEHSSDGDRDRIVEHFLEIFNQLFDLKTTGGPVFEMFFRCALTLTMSDPQATLADFVRFFYDKDYRTYCLALSKDAFVNAVWEKIVATTGGDLSLANIAPYIVSKLSPFLLNKQMRGMLSCRESTLNFDAVVRGRKILLVNLAVGTVGSLAASFTGMLMTEKILRAAMNPANKSRPGSNYYLYADEFQAIAYAGVGKILSEARKYNLGAVLAHQFLGQLPAGVLRAALGNAGNVVCMRAGNEDATLLAEYFQSSFTKADLLSLPIGVAAASTLNAGVKTPSFLLSTMNGLAFSSDPGTVRQEKSGIAEKPAASAEKQAKRSRRGLRPTLP